MGKTTRPWSASDTETNVNWAGEGAPGIKCLLHMREEQTSVPPECVKS